MVPPRGRIPRTSGTPSDLAVGLQRAAPAIPVAEELVAVDADPFADHGADDRVESRAIATAGEHADPHRPSLEVVHGGRSE